MPLKSKPEQVGQSLSACSDIMILMIGLPSLRCGSLPEYLPTRSKWHGLGMKLGS